MKADRSLSEPIRRALERLHDDEASHSIAELAAISGLSRRYLLRRFSAEIGITPASYARARRLLRAAYRLLYRKKMSVTDVAVEAGYGSLEAFSRAFRKWLGQSPAAFRDKPNWIAWSHAVSNLSGIRATSSERPPEVRIERGEPRWVAALTHNGLLIDLHQTLNRFIEWRQATRRPPHVSATFNLLHDEASEVSSDRIHITLCAETPRPIGASADGIRPLLIPGGRVARLPVRGGDLQIRRQAAWLLHQWLPASGEERLDFPLYVQRLKFFPEVAEEAAESVLNLPLRDVPS